VSNKLLASDPHEVERFLRATLMGMRYMRAFGPETNAILKKNGAPLDEKTLAIDYADTVKTLTAKGDEPDDVLRKDMAARAGILNLPADRIPPVSAVYDYRLVHQANDELNKSGWKPAP
jgi:hypothetical protein